MSKRIFLIHPYRPSMAPLEEAMARLWPEATVFNLLEESLYAEVDNEGVISPLLVEHLKALFKYVELAGADGAIFTGSTFGPAVDAARAAGKTVEIVPYWVSGAQAALNAGNRAKHDDLLRLAAAQATDCDVLLMGQISMAPAARVIAPRPGRLLLTSPDTTVAKLRTLLGA